MIAALPRWVKRIPAFLLLLLLCSVVQAQDRVITGKVTDSKDGSPLIGATVTVKGTTQGVSTGADGSFRINVPASAKTLVISSVGYGSQEMSIGSGDVIDATLTATNANLNEVVVVGYGTVRKKDLTGSVATVKEKDFNQGVMSAPDQLIQGKVAGVQILNNSGQPGGQTTVRIRGTASIRAGGGPLYVVDGVQLPGGSARPGMGVSGIGSTPDANPLNFINPQDIVSMDVLKDASATAIYGSRGANGVVLVTTKRGQSGQPKLDIASNFGVSKILKKLKVLSASEYRDALGKYGVTGSDWGSDVDGMDAITRTAFTQNYTVGLSGGTENARMRASFGYMDQQGIVLKSGIKKYTANLNGAYKFLESKKLGVDINILASHVAEDIAPVSTDAGFEGSLIGMALQWNPTRALRNADGSYNIEALNGFPATVYNPLAVSAAYNDKSKTTSVLASVSPYFKITKDLEYRMLLSMNYSLGNRSQYFSNWINIQAIQAVNGIAQTANNEQFTRQVTHTLNYTKQINKDFNLGAMVGYEYFRFEDQGRSMNAQGFNSNSLPYVDYFNGSSTTNRGLNSYHNPTAELQSMFARVNVNLKDKYLATVTMRADGSNKFGSNNKYGYFPSAALAWNISEEDFLKESSFVNTLKLRLGWGRTGNQEFPSGAAQARYIYIGSGAVSQTQYPNPDLKWETSTTTNAGIDFSLLKSRFYGTIEYFIKKTNDLLLVQPVTQPGPNGVIWKNSDGVVTNSGVEFTLNAAIIDKAKLNWTVSVFASFLKNKFDKYTGADLFTGAISGQGLTGALAQKMANGQPLNSFWMARYTGLDHDGNATFEGGDPNVTTNRFFVGSPNPKTLLGFSTTLSVSRFSVTANMNGALGQMVYNNTTQAALAIGNIIGNKNIAKSVYNPNQLENKSASQPVSTRYLEKGDYFKMANLTLSYGLGRISNTFKSAGIFLTGQNLFIITKYTGFDPEVNTPKPINDIPSFGIEYTPYPPARTIMLGINLSL